MNEKDYRLKFVETAGSYSGCNEADESHQLIIDMYNSIKPLPAGYRLSYSDPWCAAFVSAMAKTCGLLDIVYAECSCDRMIAKFKAAGRWQGTGHKPQMGDIIFYDWDRSGTADHVGIIVSVSGLTIKVIEGNISNKVGYRNIVVDDKCICGYGLPDFAAKETGASSSSGVTDTNVGNKDVYSTTVGSSVSKCSVMLPILRQGSAGNGVKALQLLLIGNGYSCGSYGADGDFGSATKTAVVAMQKAKQLDPDGIVGRDSWTALHN